MSGARALLICAVLCVARPAHGDGALLFLGGSGTPAIDEAELIDTVAIYTRDLALSVEVRRQAAPDEVTGEALGQIAADVALAGARLAFWYGPGPGPGPEVILYTVGPAPSGDKPEVHALRVPLTEWDN